MRIAFNPSTVAALTTAPNNKDITFDLRGRNIFARGVKFCGTDTNTWRDIKINNVSIGSHTLDLRNGSNTTLTNTNGVVTINSTWRPVVDNLTSDSATSSLSANQGRVLAGLINGKSDSDHNHDGRYLKLTGGTLTGNLVGTSAIFSGRFYGNGNDEGIIIKPASNGYAGLILGTHDGERSIFYFVKNKPFWRYSHGSDNLDIIHPKKSGTIALISDIPNKNSWNYDDRYLKLTGGTMKGQISSNYSVASWIAGCTSAILKANADGYNSLICAPTKSGNVCISAWTAQDNLNFGYAKKGKIENNFDTKMYWDAPNNNLHAAAFTGHLYGTADNAVNSDTTDGVHLEWSGELGVNDYTQLAGWTNDGKKIKAVNKNQFATSGHTHDGRYVYNYGGTDANGQALNQNALFMSTTSGIAGGWWHILQAAWNGEYRWNSQIAFPTQNRNGMYYRSGLDDNTKWGSWVKLLDVNNYSSTLDSRYYTESEVNNLLSEKLDRVNLTTGTWNPRGYSLAADYHYNGGDLSISENGGKMYVSINGQFYQNGGQYRVLDTSDIGSILGGLTLYQHLSDTDTNWYPLVWGGGDHKNTYNSTGSLYKSYDKLSWQTSSQTLYATNIQTENIKHLSIGGGIFWNPYVESATDSSNAASITLVKSGVAGGTTLVLSQMNEANDTIQFKTSTAARLYHNSYPILTTQNTYVSNNKGYIDGTEITEVNTAQYLRSLGNQNCQTGRTQAYGDVYSYNTYQNTGSPTVYTSVIGFGRGTKGTVEIAGGWLNTNLYWRSLKDCCEGWFPWRVVLDSSNYTKYIGNYYWANVKISASANTQTQPSVNTIYANNWFRSQGTSGWYSESYGGGIWMNDSSWIRTYGGKSFYCDNQIYSSNSIRMSNILLENTDEINNITNNGSLNLNYRNLGNVSLCVGGGKVGIGLVSPVQKLDVNGQVKASGFHHSFMDNNNYILLAGGGYNTIFTDVLYKYTDNKHYNLAFRKLSGICNNLVWVDGYVYGSIDKYFSLADKIRPYIYNNDQSMNSVYVMSASNFISISGTSVHVKSDSTYRVGFFYVGRA